MHFKIILFHISLLIHNYVDRFVFTKWLYSQQQPSYFIQRDEHVVHLRKIIFIICVEQEDQFSAIWESVMGSNNAEIIYRAECRRTLFIKCFAHQGCWQQKCSLRIMLSRMGNALINFHTYSSMYNVICVHGMLQYA